jgi:hypothetical protein
MSSGVNKIINSKFTPQKKSGSALKSALASAFSPSKIAAQKTETLPIKKPGKSK